MNGWGTPAQIALYVGRPVRTIRNWAASGTIESRRDDETGVILVSASSARKYADTRPYRKRLLNRKS